MRFILYRAYREAKKQHTIIMEAFVFSYPIQYLVWYVGNYSIQKAKIFWFLIDLL